MDQWIERSTDRWTHTQRSCLQSNGPKAAPKWPQNGPKAAPKFCRTQGGILVNPSMHLFVCFSLLRGLRQPKRGLIHALRGLIMRPELKPSIAWLRAPKVSGTFSWSFLSSFLALKRLLRSFSKSEKLLKQVHVNIPREWVSQGLTWATRGLT